MQISRSGSVRGFFFFFLIRRASDSPGAAGALVLKMALLSLEDPPEAPARHSEASDRASLCLLSLP